MQCRLHMPAVAVVVIRLDMLVGLTCACKPCVAADLCERQAACSCYLGLLVCGLIRALGCCCCCRINTLLEEAENERMHLLTFMEMRQPGGAPLHGTRMRLTPACCWSQDDCSSWPAALMRGQVTEPHVLAIIPCATHLFNECCCHCHQLSTSGYLARQGCLFQALTRAGLVLFQFMEKKHLVRTMLNA